MLSMRRIVTIWLCLLALLALTGRASAFYQEGTCRSGRATASASLNTVLPGGALNDGDVIILWATSFVASAPDITITGGTGTWTLFPATGVDAGNNLAWSGTSGKAVIAWHIWHSGDTPPTITANTASSTLTYQACAFFGADPTAPIDVAKGQTASSQTVTFPSLTPNFSNDELLLNAFGNYGATPTWNTPSTITTCGVTSDLSPLTQNATNVWTPSGINGVTTGNPDNILFYANQGPCAAAATTAATIATTAASAQNIGIAVLLKSAPFTVHQPALGSNKLRNMAGVSDFITYNQGRTTMAMSVYNQPWFDDFGVYQQWGAFEPAVGVYAFDFLDNWILNARVLGKKIVFKIFPSGNTPCGAANQPACGSFQDNSGAPLWAFSSNTQSGNVAPGQINSVWNSGYGPPSSAKELMLDPVDAAVEQEIDAYITVAGNRWGAAGANISNVVGVYTDMPSTDVGGIHLNKGTNGSAVVCNGTGSQCNAISGDADWPGTSQTVALNHIILPTASSNNSGCSTGSADPCVFKATTGGTTSASTQPTWSSCTTTCSDGSVVWTNQGAFSVTLADAAQWLALTPRSGGSYGTANTGACTGASQPWVVCDSEAGQKHYDASWHTAFPSAVLDMSQNNGLGGPDPNGTYTGATDPFFADMFQTATSYDEVTYPGVATEQDDSFGCAQLSCPGIAVPYLPYSLQPIVGVSGQEAIGQHAAPAICQKPSIGTWSFSATDCVPPVVETTIGQPVGHMDFPYMEFYLADLQNAPDAPWFALFHQFAMGPLPTPD